MKNIKINFIILLLVSTSVFAQFGPPQFVDNLLSPISIVSADFDGDGDMDLLTAGENDDSLAWYEKLDGLGVFSPPNEIQNSGFSAKFLISIDIDNDGDKDVIAALNSDIGLYKNIDGLGNFGPEILTDLNANPYSIDSADVDGDGDNDLIVGTYSNVSFYENTDGQGLFVFNTHLSNNETSINKVYCSDIDSDGDIDIVFTSRNDNKIGWFKNLNGQGTFSSSIIISTSAISPRDLKCADIDGDGYIDITAVSDDDKVAWYRNIDGQGAFTDEIIISTNVFRPYSINVNDLDGDDDLDMVIGNRDNQIIAWYENNDGHGTFSTEIFIQNDNGARYINSTDIDGDGDIDILAAGLHNISWYENLSPLLISENDFLIFTIYPIPSTEILFIESKIGIQQIEIYNTLGQTYDFQFFEGKIDVSQLMNGTYYIKVIDFNNNIGVQKFIKK